MKPGLWLVLALSAALGACMPGPPPFPPGAKEHGPYLDRSFEGYVVRAVFEQDVTILTVQEADKAPEPPVEAYVGARALLETGNGVFSASPPKAMTDKAADFEAVAMQAAGIPGWCREGTTFGFVPPPRDGGDFNFKIRGAYSGDIGAFLFAGQCR